jgi:hypothetical protein
VVVTPLSGRLSNLNPKASYTRSISAAQTARSRSRLPEVVDHHAAQMDVPQRGDRS